MLCVGGFGRRHFYKTLSILLHPLSNLVHSLSNLVYIYSIYTNYVNKTFYIMTKFNTRTKEVQNLRNLQVKVSTILDLLDPVCELALELDIYNDYEMRIHSALVTAVDELVTAKIYLERRVRGLSRRKE